MLLLLLLSPVLLALIAIELWGRKVGDCRVSLRIDQLGQKEIYLADEQHACLRFTVPLKNTGNQQALIIDAHAQLQPAGELYSDLQPVTRLVNPECPRQDGYWEATIIKAGRDLKTVVELWISSPDVETELLNLEALRIDYSYKFYCRNPLAYRREEIFLDLDSFRRVDVLQPLVPPVGPEAEKEKKPDPEARVVPLRTPLLRPGDDVVEVVRRYTEGVGKPGDIVALAESAVAICQGRLIYCEDIRPGFFATRLNKIFDMNSSMSSVYAMEAAIKEAGLPRILMSTAAGVLGKLRGKPGEFYRLAGRPVAVIDDCTGTLPPFDKHVVLGPARGDELCAKIKNELGYEATIVDANDLGKVDVLHLTDPGREHEVVEALKPNPQGNAGEMTPLVLIKKQEAPTQEEAVV